MSSITPQEIKAEFLKSKIGIAGIAILSILIFTSVIVVVVIPVDTFKEWNNPGNWISYPKVAIPVWINLFLSEKQYLNLELLLVKYGDSAPEFIRSLIRKAFEKEFGSYKSPSSMKIKPIKESDIEPELDLTAEQWCEKGGGVVKMKDGMMQAVFPLAQ